MDLLQKLNLEVANTIKELLRRKKSGTELDAEDRIEVLIDFL